MQLLPLFQSSLMSVTELTRYVRGLFESDDVLRDVWVQGEVSNFSRPASGHYYFTLKDSTAALRCVVWKSTALRLRFAIQNGLAIEAHGAISVYERDGQYQLYVDAVRPVGEGLLYQEYLRLKTRLEAEGLFDEDRKRQIPERPRCIGIVTSPTGAALQDVLNTLKARYPLAEVVISPAAVQGETAPAEIVAALGRLNNQVKPDIIIVARGGGSLEDLWAFNDESVVRAVAESAAPVITGVGHETDFTLVDFACDQRAPTPTGAAVMAAPDKIDLQYELSRLSNRLNGATSARVVSLHQNLSFTQQRLGRTSPENKIRTGRQAVDEAQARSTRALSHRLQLHRARLAGLHSRLLALNPTAVLQRGFAIIERADGRLIGSAREVQVLDDIIVRMEDGSLAARVTDIHAGQG